MKPAQIDGLLSGNGTEALTGNGHESQTVAEQVPIRGNAPELQQVDEHESIPGNEQPSLKDSRRIALVKRINAMLQNGTSYQAVAARLNEDGEPALSGRGKWQGRTIKNMMR